MSCLDKPVRFAVFILCWTSRQSALAFTAGQVGEADGFDEVSLLQASTFPKPGAKTLEAAAVSEGALKASNLMDQMRVAYGERGEWSVNRSDIYEGCGLATPAEMQMPIPMWQAKNPGVRGYCFFANVAYWFPIEDHVTNSKDGEYTWNTFWKDARSGAYSDNVREWTHDSGATCQSYGADGPEVRFDFDGLSFTWNHLRDCLDVVDDPYCYSLGWLKGQLPRDFVWNATWAKMKGKSECERLQDEFHFIDEEVTVGRHVMGTPTYFEKTQCSLTGGCPGVTRRIHAEHVYTKCLLGAESGEWALAEMSYCYHKGCVLEGNRIGHSGECRYVEDDD